MNASAERVQQACAFMVADHCFAIDADLVTEVLHGGSLSPVPLAPESIVGLLHLRGRIVPVIDMRRRLGFAALSPSAVRTHLVLRQQDERYSLLVDEVLDVHDFPAERIEQPAKAVGPATDAVSGVFPGPAGLVHFLDPQRIVQSLVRQRTAPFIRHGASHGG
ncbi:MAG: chemotaxis protein CheW [Planctomycetia bacterium]|jgi:purine-binding chemotaxis protein CheW